MGNPPPETILHEEKRPKSGRSTLVNVLIYAFVIGLLALLGWGLVQANKGQPDSGAAPDFTITSFEGETLNLRDLRGQVVVLNFWASWCPPCRDEAPYLERTWRKYKEQGVIFVGIDYVDTEAKALAYIEEFDITYFNGPDIGTKISRDYHIQGVPETYYIDRNGNIRGLKVGPVEPPELDQMIEMLIAE